MLLVIDLLRKNRSFFLSYGFILLTVGILQIAFSQEYLMQAVNVRNSISADYFFTYATYMGDGAFFVGVCLILLLINWRYGTLSFASFTLSSLISIFLKQVAFPKSLRPLKFFEHSTFEYHIIKGLDIYSYNSFPSGHSTSAFALFCMLALLNPRKKWNWLLLLPALITAYSRVYLFQHFVEDVYVGSLVGTLSSIIVYLVLTRLPAFRNHLR